MPNNDLNNIDVYIYCKKLQQSNNNITASVSNNIFYQIHRRANRSNDVMIRLTPEIITSKQACLDWLSENTPEIVYLLEEPTTTQITDTTLISDLEQLINSETYKNITNINITSSDLSPNTKVIYKKDLEKLFNDLTALVSSAE